ncbi:MAG: hypothetical protein V4481_03160 [Patescibacteria group bacterium]
MTTLHIHSKNYEKFGDEELIRGTARGNDILYAELMRRYMRSIFHFAAQHVGIARAQHITEETFYTFWKGANVFTKEYKLRRELFDTARELIRLHLQNSIPTLPLRVMHLTKYQITSKKSFLVPHISLIELSDRVRKQIEAGKSWYRELEPKIRPSLVSLFRFFPSSVSGRSKLVPVDRF